MARDEVSIPLVMVSTPEYAAPKVRRSRAGNSFNRYNVIWIVQKLAVLIFMALLSVAVYYFVSQNLVRSVKVVGVSMFPTLHEGSTYLLDRRAFNSRDPEHGDIVVIRDPGDHGLAVKRIIAVSGESIYFKDGNVFVNGKKLDEPYLPSHTPTFTYAKAKAQFITCGQDQYFVLGDNRELSVDSRAYGTVSRQGILGLVKVN
ncbi:MAG TPA: signal peptidase I [Verrucomicrobiae bacterium]|jgi:signal peptidase I|nr:signal peptidase I [Verrucomicrobiae bacterium]